MSGTQETEKAYLPVKADIQSEDEEEQHHILGVKRTFRKTRKFSRMFWASVIIHVLTAASLVGLWSHNITLRKRLNLYGHKGRVADPYFMVEEPYTPAAEAIEYDLYQFRASKIFQSEPNDEVDQAWLGLLRKSEGMVYLSPETAGKLQGESIEYKGKPGTYVYGIAMFHELHCLDHIRRSFNPERYFADDHNKDYQLHKAHCIDLLRQHIMCSGNVQLLPLWNKDYSSTIVKTLPDGTASKETQYSEYYKSLNITERDRNALAQWNIVHKCRNPDKISAWAWDPSRAAYVK